MFSITETRTDAQALREQLKQAEAGAIVIFEGCVRNHNNGQQVLELEYEAFVELAVSEGLKIIEEARAKFAILKAMAVHRTGRLALTEPAVIVGAAAIHRDAAFKACRYIIDQIKARLPIWKKEYYTSGASHWVNCRHEAVEAQSHSHEASPSYRGHLSLTEIRERLTRRLIPAKAHSAPTACKGK